MADRNSPGKSPGKVSIVTSTASLLVAVILVAVKYYAYHVSGSTAVLADTFVSLLNIMASLFALGSIAILSRGSGGNIPRRLKAFSAGFQGTILVITGVGIFMAGWPLIFNGAAVYEIKTTLLILLAAFFVKLVLGLGLMFFGRKINAEILIRQGSHALREIGIAGAVLFGLVLIQFTGAYFLDGILACIVALFILARGGRLLFIPFEGLKDAQEPDFLNSIYNLLNDYRKDIWVDIHRLRAKFKNNRIAIDFHLILPRDITLKKGQEESKELKRVFNGRFKNDVDLFVHVEPCIETDCPFCIRQDCKLREREGPMKEHHWSLKSLTADGGPSERLQNDSRSVPAHLMSKAMIVADNNPELLEWLFEALAEEGLNHNIILDRMEMEPPENRENVLGRELLAQQPPGLRKMLAMSLAFHLPVPQKVIKEVCDKVYNLEEHLLRAGTLGLITVTRLSSEKNYQTPRILLPHLKADLPSDMLWLAKKSVQALHKAWFKGNSSPTREQALEVHRLAMVCKEANITLEVTDFLATLYGKEKRYKDILDLCEKSVKVVAKDYILHRHMAVAEKALDNVNRSLRLLQQALTHCPPNALKDKAKIMHSMAEIYGDSGQTGKALELFKQTLLIRDNIKDFQEKPATLESMAAIYLRHGSRNEALGKLRESLDLQDRVGMASRKGATLYKMAKIYDAGSDPVKALALYEKAVKLVSSPEDITLKEAAINRVAEIYAEQGRIKEALSHFQQLLEIKQQKGDTKGKAAILSTMSKLSVSIFEQLKSPDMEKVKKIMAKR